MTIFKYIFFINKEKIEVYNFNSKKNKLKNETNRGERSFPIESDFWEWWSESVSFTENDEVDFCFVYDEYCDMMDAEFLKNCKKADNSCWNEESVENFFNEVCPYSNIEIIDGNEKSIKMKKSNARFLDSSLKVFHLNICLNSLAEMAEKYNVETKILNNDSTALQNEIITPNDMTPFAKYYRSKLKEESVD